MTTNGRPALFAVYAALTSPACTLSPFDRWLAVVIAQHIGCNAEAWPSVRRLREVSGISERALRYALARLCSGPAALFDRTPGGARSGDRYAVASYRLRGSRDEGLRGARDAGLRGARDAGLNDARGASHAGEGGTPCRRGVHGVPTEKTTERTIEKNGRSPEQTPPALETARANGNGKASESSPFPASLQRPPAESDRSQRATGPTEHARPRTVRDLLDGLNRATTLPGLEKIR